MERLVERTHYTRGTQARLRSARHYTEKNICPAA